MQHPLGVVYPKALLEEICSLFLADPNRHIISDEIYAGSQVSGGLEPLPRRRVGGVGGHRAQSVGGDSELTGSTRQMQFGDPFRLDIPRTVTNAVMRTAVDRSATSRAMASDASFSFVASSSPPATANDSSTISRSPGSLPASRAPATTPDAHRNAHH